MVIHAETTQARIEEAFRTFTAKREDIAILLITQKV